MCEMEVQFDSSGGDHMETSEKQIEKWIEEVKKEVMRDEKEDYD